MIEDIETGIPLIDDAIYSAPKYHFNYNGRLLLRIARLPVPRGLGQRHQIRKHGARVGSQIAAPRPRLPGRIPAQPVERHFESVQLHVAEGQLPYLDGTFQCRRDFLQLREPEPLHARQVDRRLRDDRDIRDHDEPLGSKYGWKLRTWAIRVRALPASAGAVPLRITPTRRRPSASPTRCSWWPAATKRCSTVPRPIS